MSKHTTGISLEQETYNNAKALAKKKRWSFSLLVQVALEEFLTNQIGPMDQAKPVVSSSVGVVS